MFSAPTQELELLKEGKNNEIKLTNRQTECLYYLAKGLAPKQIARLLNISSRTVEHHIVHLKNKFECYSRSGLICKAFEIPAIKIRLLTN